MAHTEGILGADIELMMEGALVPVPNHPGMRLITIRFDDIEGTCLY
jgi:hypothetical protein